MKANRERNLRLIDGKWYLDFTFRGKRHREFGGYTKDQARNSLTKLRADLLDIARGFKKPASADVSFEKFADDFLELYCKPSKRSWDRDEISLNHLKTFFAGVQLVDVGAEAIERYKVSRKAEVSSATTNRELACLKTLLNKAVEWGRIEKSPAARVKKLKEAPGRERILTREESARLVAAAGPDVRPVLIVALNTGMRRGEILGLKWTDVDLVRGVIAITTSKSGKGRKVFMNGHVAAALGAVPHRGEYVFWNSETKTHIKDVKTGFVAAMARAKKNPDDEKDPGITGVRFHDLRHTAASRMVEAGVDLVTVSKILGHSSIQMTMRYAHPTPEAFRQAVNLLGDFMVEPAEHDRKSTTRPVAQA
ncbi:MAG: site-specific integrase [Acidobacteria bacterium]|nr:site-specific integrase [Acidobacteriota bacterium]